MIKISSCTPSIRDNNRPIIPNEIWIKIGLLLDEKNLLNFERVKSDFQLTANSNCLWKNMKIKSHVNFSWALCAKEPHREKSEYFINKAIFNYAKLLEPEPPKIGFFAPLLNLVSERFLCLKGFIEKGFLNEENKIGVLP